MLPLVNTAVCSGCVQWLCLQTVQQSVLQLPVAEDIQAAISILPSYAESEDDFQLEEGEKEQGGLGTVAIIATAVAGVLGAMLLCIVCQGKRRAAATRAGAAADARSKVR